MVFTLPGAWCGSSMLYGDLVMSLEIQSVGPWWQSAEHGAASGNLLKPSEP